LKITRRKLQASLAAVSCRDTPNALKNSRTAHARASASEPLAFIVSTRNGQDSPKSNGFPTLFSAAGHRCEPIKRTEETPRITGRPVNQAGKLRARSYSLALETFEPGSKTLQQPSQIVARNARLQVRDNRSPLHDLDGDGDGRGHHRHRATNARELSELLVTKLHFLQRAAIGDRRCLQRSTAAPSLLLSRNPIIVVVSSFLRARVS